MTAERTPPLVLVVDDDPDLREIFAEVLADEGYRTAVATDGLDALAAIDREHPDVVLLDAAMPRLDGAGFCRAYREAGGCAPVIVVSAGTPEILAAMAEACGAAAFIAKPFDIDELLGTVARLVGR